MIRDLSYICSNCEKSVLGLGVFLSSNGVQEGFCNFQCCFSWLGKRFAEAKEKVAKANRERVIKETEKKQAKAVKLVASSK